MVAYTSPDCLPYFTATDPLCLNTGTLCDPSTVWCDFAELVDAQLDMFDEVVARAATSVPMAWVETTTPFSYTIGDPTLGGPFDTVRVDTNNMVDLDLNQSAITVTRDGLYQIGGYGTGIYDRAAATTGIASASISFLPFLTTIMGTATPFSFDADAALAVDLEVFSFVIQGVMPLQVGQSAVMGLTGSGLVGDLLIYTKLTMSAVWVGDLP